MTRSIITTSIFLIMFATITANAATNQVSVKFRFEIPRYLNVNWFPENDAKKDKDDKKDKKDKSYKNAGDFADDIIDNMNISSNSDGRIIMSVDGKETEYGYEAGNSTIKTIEKSHSTGEVSIEYYEENSRASTNTNIEEHQIAITILSSI